MSVNECICKRPSLQLTRQRAQLPLPPREGLVHRNGEASVRPEAAHTHATACAPSVQQSTAGGIRASRRVCLPRRRASVSGPGLDAMGERNPLGSAQCISAALPVALCGSKAQLTSRALSRHPPSDLPVTLAAQSFAQSLVDCMKLGLLPQLPGPRSNETSAEQRGVRFSACSMRTECMRRERSGSS